MMNVSSAIRATLLGSAAKPAMERLHKSAEGFEAVFIKDLLSAMRKSMPTSTQSFTTGMIQDMFDDALSKTAAQKGDFGLANTMYKSLSPAAMAQEFDRLNQKWKAGDIQWNQILTKKETKL